MSTKGAVHPITMPALSSTMSEGECDKPATFRLETALICTDIKQ